MPTFRRLLWFVALWAAGVLAVGAVGYDSPDVPRAYSSSGPVKILFDLDGVWKVRQQAK